MMVVNSFDLWQKDVFFSAAEEVQKSADIMESAYRLWIREKKDEICKELQAALGTAKWQLEEFEKAVRLSHKRCGDDDSSSTRHRQFVTAIENQIHRVETSLQEAYSENGKKPLRWVDLNEEERDDLAMFLSGSSRISESFSGESSIESRESTNSSLVENLPGKNRVEVNCKKETFKQVKGCGNGSECVIDIEERAKPGNADARIRQVEKSAGMRRIWSSPNFNSLRIIVPGGDNQEEKETLVAQIEATPKVKGTKSVLWMQRLPDHNQERDELVRKGILTPFHKLDGFERRLQQPGPSNSRYLPEEDDENDKSEDSNSIDRAVQSMSLAAKARPTTKLLDAEDLPKLEPPTAPFRRLRKLYKTPDSPDNEVKKSKDGKKSKNKRPLPEKKWRKRISREDSSLQESGDGRRILTTSSCEEEEVADFDDADDNETSSVQLEGGLNIPECIFRKLFEYQRVGVQWLWELHCQRAGGIIGDEMGLGKTIQVLSFLGSLHFSKMYKPSIIICPVTLLRQWRREAQKWYPDFHVEILHDSAQDSGHGKGQGKANESDYDSECSVDSDHEQKSKNPKKWDSLINRVLNSESGLLITTYEQLRLQGEKLLNIEWGYAVLDEGHRIRNPNSDITLVCKQLQTVHRIIMTGAPIQNKLTELWSLFDFVFPGKLGVLPVFEAEFSVPITVGGYANASPLQVSTAYRCAVVLRDLIMPYLLRRMKADVNAHLTKKTEHVLFCSLTVEQRSTYRAFLASSEVEQILDGNKNSLYGIDVMRKICNHPDLLEREHSHQNPDYGNPERSGKMKVVAEVLKVWKQQGHRVLLFSQTQQMLDILESFLVANEYSYRRMDGLTPVKQRMALIDEFNNSDDVFVFVLTTKVGGLGTNLTGANRVIIFDPDWNPSNDMQARERAWRIGQKKDVTVYRLITRGTIEEKVYHRQIYKHFLTNKILKNPQQRRFFKARDMKDLFILKDDGDSNASTETSNIFSQLAEEINIVGAQSEKKPESATQLALHNTAEGSSEQTDVETTDKSGEAMDEETNILKSLFDAHGIHSAVNHDAIMNANDEEEKMRLEHQASQVARRAAEALRESRMLRSRESISVPTWTGRSGCAGAPSSVRRRFGSTVNSRLTQSGDKPSVIKNGISAGLSSGKAPSSAELLNRIRGSREQAIGVGLEQPQSSFPFSSGSSSRVGSLQPEVLIRKICSFVQQKGGSADTTSIVNHFRDIVSFNDKPLFKNLLREIATLKKDQNRSFWVLKSEYKD